jgi:D-alanyl-D-alanine carboxypeptidase (penicillin-binding protein 5/6)
MKRTYDHRYASRDRRASFRRGVRRIYTSRRAIAVGVLVLLLLLFVLSCFLTLSDAHVTRAAVSTSKTFAGAQGVAPAKPSPYAEAACLMDETSGRVIYSKNAHEKLPIASTTKMVTALVVRQKLKLTDQVVVSKAAAAVGEQGLGLIAGQSLSVEDLLYGLMVQSANDAAYALAEKASGSIPAFAAEMNKEAAALGAVDSHFINPHGLDQAGHYSSAYDLCVIARQVLKDPVLAKMVQIRKYTMQMPGHPGGFTIYSHNEFLLQYPNANGVKTGYTGQAGWCLVGSETRNGKTFIASALNSQHRAQDVAEMINYGFSATDEIVFLQQGQQVGQTRVSNFPRRSVNAVSAAQVSSCSIKGAGDNFTLKVKVDRGAKPPVKQGQVIGKAECYLNGQLLYTSDVVSASKGSSSGPFVAFFAFIWYAFCWMGKILFAPFRIF